MIIDYRTLLAEAICDNDAWKPYAVADDVLATRIPDLCHDCDQGDVKHLPYSQTCTHPNAPTIADLLRWGEAVAKAEPVVSANKAFDTYYSGFNDRLAALRGDGAACVQDNPYRFTVRVEHYFDDQWLVRIWADDRNWMTVVWFRTEAEAREHARLIGAALRNVEVQQ